MLRLTIAVSLRVTSGYKFYYTSFKRFLEMQSFTDEIVIVGKQDWIATGNFEVTVGETLVHSNKQRHEGFARGTKEREAICQAIQHALKERSMM